MTKMTGSCCASPLPPSGRAHGGECVHAASTPVSFRWCRLEGGAFRMGAAEPGFPADGEGPVRSVRLSRFAIAAYAVTNRQFGDFVTATGYLTDAERFNWSFVFEGLLSAAVKARVQRVPREAPW